MMKLITGMTMLFKIHRNTKKEVKEPKILLIQRSHSSSAIENCKILFLISTYLIPLLDQAILNPLKKMVKTIAKKDAEETEAELSLAA